jgi:hypothetical protein
MILGIDPGNIQTAYCLYSVGAKMEAGIVPNEVMLRVLNRLSVEHPGKIVLAIEMVASYGMPVGQEVFATCVWIGRYVERWAEPVRLVYRKEVMLHLCGVRNAKDKNIRQALLDRFGPQGTKKAPGTTYGISKDMWSALAVAVTASETSPLKTEGISR